jgi:hypothetical protein
MLMNRLTNAHMHDISLYIISAVTAQMPEMIVSSFFEKTFLKLEGQRSYQLIIFMCFYLSSRSLSLYY